jgi:hypothetical protein
MLDEEAIGGAGCCRAHGGPLGEVLLEKGWIEEETLANAFPVQDDLELANLHADRLPRQHRGERWPGFPICRGDYIRGESRAGPIMGRRKSKSQPSAAERTERS